MNRFIFLFLFSFFSLIALESHADFVRDSGIDLDASQLVIDFTAPVLLPHLEGEYPAFECFGFFESPVTVSFQSIGMTDPDNLTAVLQNTANGGCFRQAGTYELDVFVQDKAGNTAFSSVFPVVIEVLPSDPHPSQITHHVTYDDNNKATPSLANDSDKTIYTLILKDFAGNPVTQIDGDDIQLPAGYVVDTNGQTDANTGLSFLDGFANQEVNTDAAWIQLSFKAKAPTVAKVGDHLARFTDDWSLRMSDIQVADINSAGGVVGGVWNPVSVTTPVRVAFQPLFTLIPKALEDSVMGETQDAIYILDSDYVHPEDPDPPTGSNNASRFFLELQSKDSGISLNSFAVRNEDSWLSYYNNLASNSFSPSVELDTTFYDWGLADPEDDDSWSYYIQKTAGFVRDMSTEKYPLSLVVEGNYSVGGSPISYPMGGSGFHETDVLNPANNNPNDFIDLTTRNGGVSGAGTLGYNSISGGSVPPLGADVVGAVRGVIDSRMTSSSSVLVSGTVGEDARSILYDNALSLIRGIEESCLNPIEQDRALQISVFDTCDVVVVNDGGDVRFASGWNQGIMLLPAGQKTLIVQNANVIIEGNMMYGNPNDAFGIMAINTPLRPFPETGNIFVRSDIQQIVGHLFLEGAFVSNDGDSIWDANTGTDQNQLVFQGTFLTHNTLGGSRITPVRTPWERTNDTLQLVPVEIEDQRLSQIYDLHWVRTGNSMPVHLSNQNAFVLEVKPPLISPPGFVHQE